ncbi:MAG: DUF4262 domain-containing protein [Hyphomonadaceae bacterium]|nr:DUF4262 domain-containing protein [Hyphomonadaceae bacterium]
MDKKAREAELDRKLLESIDKYGWFGMSVASKIDDPNPIQPFSYSIGFEKTLNCPNVIVFGLKSSHRHHMIWQVFEALKSGRKLEQGAKWPEPLDGYECETRAVHESRIVSDHFGYGLWYQRTHVPEAAPYRAFQLFWPGVGHRLLPWEPGCDEAVINAQPRLDLPRTISL